MQKKMPYEDDDDRAAEDKAAKPPDQAHGSTEETKEPGVVNRFFRRASRVLLVSGVLFVAGLVTGYLAFHRPQATELNNQIDQLSSEKADLEAQLLALEEDVEALEPLEGENRVLESSLADAELHVRVLAALKDVQSAQLGLALGETDAARLSLSRTEVKLEELQELLPADQQGVVDGMLQRLNLVIDGMDSDAFAAQSDLDVLANSLLQLENTLFITP
jgi:outer membrane murein-binding lipoprotein Lpp